MKIKLNVDVMGYKEKPVGKEDSIRLSIGRADRIRELTPDELIEAIRKGYTFTPAASAASWTFSP